jgi:hypothetical protein
VQNWSSSDPLVFLNEKFLLEQIIVSSHLLHYECPEYISALWFFFILMMQILDGVGICFDLRGKSGHSQPGFSPQSHCFANP